ncbi:hypothetical protein B0H15DRAFT_59101 [Mycena belliarum]|uniref:Uncharacterized protein n=1 Tax=Mycena belliarum TaxID=1033014 RepID=A0AAD6TN95_9AGAR|nr:hypothetical protein B0H15DRAFT_59101 [Mycena belliae]
MAGPAAVIQRSVCSRDNPVHTACGSGLYASLAPTDRSDFDQRFLATDLSPSASIPAATSQYSQSWLPQFSHETSMPEYVNSGQPSWDDFGSSTDTSRSIPTRPPSSRSVEGISSMGIIFTKCRLDRRQAVPIFVMMATTSMFSWIRSGKTFLHVGYISLIDSSSTPASSSYSEDASRYCSSHDSRPVSVAPSNIPGSLPSVSVEIQLRDGTDWRKTIICLCAVGDPVCSRIEYRARRLPL